MRQRGDEDVRSSPLPTGPEDLQLQRLQWDMYQPCMLLCLAPLGLYYIHNVPARGPAYTGGCYHEASAICCLNAAV
jgi:hypothetical protein